MAVLEQTSLRVKLNLPEEIVAEYERRARATGTSLETLLAQKLSSTANWNSQRPIYINDSDRQELEKLLGRNIGTSKSLIEAIGKLAKVRVDGAEIHLNENVLVRLRSRCPRNENFEEYLKRNLTLLLEAFVGLR